jgi:hypothetical protein
MARLPQSKILSGSTAFLIFFCHSKDLPDIIRGKNSFRSFPFDDGKARLHTTISHLAPPSRFLRTLQEDFLRLCKSMQNRNILLLQYVTRQVTNEFPGGLRSSCSSFTRCFTRSQSSRTRLHDIEVSNDSATM